MRTKSKLQVTAIHTYEGNSGDYFVSEVFVEEELVAEFVSGIRWITTVKAQNFARKHYKMDNCKYYSF